MKAIAIVDDEQDDVDLTRGLFKRHNVLNPLNVYQDGESALAAFLDGMNELPLVVLLDLKLLKMSGAEVLHTLRSHAHTIALPVIVVSVTHPRELLKMGQTAYISKPMSFEAFTEACVKLGLNITFGESLR